MRRLDRHCSWELLLHFLLYQVKWTEIVGFVSLNPVGQDKDHSDILFVQRRKNVSSCGQDKTHLSAKSLVLVRIHHLSAENQ
jgi:hypothetical protein